MNAFKSTVLITGGTTGLGYECARAVAKQRPDALVIISSRSSGDNAAHIINKETGRTNVKYLRLDLADLSNVRKFASSFREANFPPISSLVLNAALQVLSLEYTADGLEKTFGISHVGHALLFYLLTPCFAHDVRIVSTSSGTHDPAQKSGLPDAKYDNAETLAHPDSKTKGNPGRQRYATTKLCNVLWTYALERRRAEKGLQWRANAFDPGLMPGTGLARDAGPIMRFLWISILPRVIPVLRLLISPNIHTAAESGAALARLAVSSEVEGVSGKYFEGLKEIDSSKDSYDGKKQEELWNWTAEYLARDVSESNTYKTMDLKLSSPRK